MMNNNSGIILIVDPFETDAFNSKNLGFGNFSYSDMN